MRQITYIILLVVCLFPAAGCHWVGLRDPVPASLTASRKLSSEGNELLEQKQPQMAELKLAEAVRTCPTDCDARRYYAETLWLRSARPEAVTQLEEACRLSPDSDLRVRLAEMYLEMGRIEESGRNIDQVLGRNQKLAAAWRVRGRVLRATGDRYLAAGDGEKARTIYYQALADLHKAAGYDPSDRQVIGETAAVYRSVGLPRRALETMQSLAETYSVEEEPQQVLYWTGLDYLALRRYDDAVTSLTAALSRDRPTPELLFSLGEAQYGCGRTQEAAASRQLLSEIQLAQQGGLTVRR